MGDGSLDEGREVLRVACYGDGRVDAAELPRVRGYLAVEVEGCAARGVLLQHGHAGVVAGRLDGEGYEGAARLGILSLDKLLPETMAMEDDG